MKSLSIIAIILLLAACASKKSTSVSNPSNTSGISQADADRGAAKFPGTTLASLVQGKANYESRCQSCHSLVSPASVAEAKWRTIVPDMVKKVNRKSPTMAIDSAMEESILRYVITMGTAPAK